MPWFSPCRATAYQILAAMRTIYFPGVLTGGSIVGILVGVARRSGMAQSSSKPLPETCGRQHPQPYCCCLACKAAKARASEERAADRVTGVR